MRIASTYSLAAAVVLLAVALALEAERARRARSPASFQGKTCSSSLRTPASRAQSTAASQQRRPHALPAGVERDHQADVGDVRARRMRVAADREPADERPVVALRDEDGRVRIAAQRLEVAALVAALRHSPATLISQPSGSALTASASRVSCSASDGSA